MQHAPRPIAAFAVVGALSLFLAGCSGGGDDPTPSPSRSSAASADPTASTPTATAPATDATTPATGTDDGSGADDGPDDDDTPGAFPGTGSTPQPDSDPADFPATAVVTFAGWDTGSRTLQAGGLVSGTTDASGTCTFTARRGSTTRTLTSAAEASASSVNCAQVSFPAAQVPSGTWSVTLQYSVGSKATTSDPMTAEVP